MLGIVLVNYNTSALSLRCLHSILAARDVGPLRVEIIDNSTDASQREVLRRALPDEHGVHLHLTAMDANVGFAAGCNRGIDALLADASVDRVLLLNNDAELRPGGLKALLDHAAAHPEADMLGASMHRMDDPACIDSLGIAMYASGLASNRKHLRDRLLGPTGGLALYSRRLLETLRDRQGGVFDERFFCYAEDTDLALRALLLGFKPGFLDHCVALHAGQASSGGGFSDFVLYHGIRNSIWTLLKTFPAALLWPLAPAIVALHAGIVARHALAGRGRVVWRLYRDALRGAPEMWRSRHAIQQQRVIGARDLWRYITPRFYDRAYLRGAWRDLWHPRAAATGATGHGPPTRREP